ncbi:MAG TPA: MBL fold metallo-hydrolase [Dehalococcoidia bacterium]|nr:MBL fold metallo-hydrolase [Dehalococcoidia bacterium]
MELVILGTGSPLPSGNRCGAGNVVTSGGDTVLIDCGWGAARRLIASGVPLGNIDTVFFTHMHSDHITDLPDFIMMRWTLGGATHPLTVYGPEGTREAVEGFRAALNPDVRYRFAHHGDKLSRDGIEVIVHETPATAAVSRVATVGEISVGAFEVDHRPVVPALGFRVEAGGAAVVFSGDTKKCDALVQASKGADMLVSEAVHLDMMQTLIERARTNGNERMAGILEEACNYHAPTLDVAAMAREAGVPRLVLSHLIPPIPDEGERVAAFIAGMGDIFPGPIDVARDMQRFTVGA